MRKIKITVGAIMVVLAAAGNPVLETDAMRVEFGPSAEGFGLRRIVNKAADGCAFVAPKAGETDLWELRIVGKGAAGTNEALNISNLASCERSFACGDGSVALAWRGIDLPGEKRALDVFVEVKAKGELTHWSITSKTTSKRWALHTTVFPYVRHVVADGEADVLLPWKNMGARLVRKYDSTKERPHLSYSPSCKPPIAAFFKGDAMLYVAAHDPYWRIKEMRYRPGNDLFFAMEAENSGIVGKAEGSPRGGFVMGCAKGDWWQAARFYREWALGQKWCAKGKLAFRKDFTRKATETDLWTLNHGTAQTFSNQVAAMAKAWPGVGVSAKWQRLSDIGGANTQNCLYTPEWLPLRPGVTETVKWAEDLGFLVMPYTNGRIWEQELASWVLAEPYACMTPDGGRRTEIYVRERNNGAKVQGQKNDGIEPRIRRYANGHRYGVMCPSCPQWHKVVAEVTRKLVDGEPYVNAVYVDQVSCSPPYPCRDPAHGHPLGGGRWWNDGIRAMMSPIHDEANRKGVVLTSEQFGDYVLDYFDAFLNATEHSAEDVPFFPAVYSGYAIYYGTEVHWKDDDAARFALCARTFSWGVAIGWIPGYEIANPAFKTHADIYYAFGKARKSAREYLAYGSLVDELRPIDPLPRCTFSWWRTETRRGKESYTNDMPAVIGTVWRDADDSKMAVVAVNISPEWQTVRFHTPTGRNDLSARPVDGQRAPEFTVSEGIANVTLAPRQIAILEQPLPVDTRPYEFRLADRKQDFREPCDGFENAAGWRVEATDAEATFDCNSSRMLFGAKTGELKYRGTGPKPVVKLLPKEAILATEADTDSLTVWVRGNHFGHGANRQFDIPSPGLFASLRLKDGNVCKYKLANTIWLDWHLVAFRLPPADLKKGIDAFLGFSLEGEMQEEFLPLHFDNLALFHDRRGPLSVPQRARRNIKPLPDADQGVNTGSGTLPFPVREETILPVAKRDDALEFSCAEGTDGPDFRVSFAGSESVSIFADGGVKAIVSDAGRAVKPVKAKRLERRTDGGDTVERWLYSATDAEAIVVYTYRRMGNSMVVDMRAEKGVVAEMSVGDMGDAKVRTSFIMPYLAYGPDAVQGNNPRRAPIVAFDVTGRDGKPATLFRYAAGDWYRSNASRVDGAEGASGRMTQRFRYLPKSDGKRVSLSERIFINISTKVDEVLPTIPNPPSPLKHITGKRLWRAHASSESRERDKFFWRTLHRYGITEVVVNDHETMWRDGGESYTFRTSFAEGKGGDKAQYEYTRFMRDELGYVYGPYDNFWDYAPVNPNFTFDNVALTSDGSYMTSWMRCYAPKAVTSPWWSEQIVPQVQRKMRFNTCYCDCHTAGSPWGRTDYDARVPGAATFSAAFYAFGDLLLCQRRDWEGPIYSEGAIRYLYAGLVDGNYADDRGYAFQSQPWIVDFDLLRIHPLECDFGMGTMSMFYPDNITLKEKRYYLPHFNSVAEREEILDRYLAATVAFGHSGFLVAEYCFDPPRTFGPAYGPTAFGKFAFEDGLPIAWRSYYMIQAAAARYTQSNVAEIGYVNAEGEVEHTSKAVLDGTVARNHVVVRYEDGTEVASNGSRKERMRVRMTDGTFDLPPCGYRVRTADGKVLVECSDAGGRKADYAESPDYIYIDGRGGMVVRDKAKSDGPAVCRILKDCYEIIPLGGAKCAFRISGGKATALDIDGKAIGTADTEVKDGWLSVRPVPGAVSYKIGR